MKTVGFEVKKKRTPPKKDAGQKWIDLVLSPEGQALLGEAGFTPVNK